MNGRLQPNRSNHTRRGRFTTRSYITSKSFAWRIKKQRHESLRVRNTRGRMSNYGGIIGLASGQHRRWCSIWKRRWTGWRRTVCCSKNYRFRSPRALAEACTLLLRHRATQHACQHLERHKQKFKSTCIKSRHLCKCPYYKSFSL